ncbi:Rieske 2Fe-2S domain-containing protein [Emcibacter sp. SYSU 3D8]|uniref:Rieske (2Fe-2S) protein n=1 Tax=Emcibacter sp. SYSU 3D8 TaxID=3133969 RepID=UPI0031FED1CF
MSSWIWAARLDDLTEDRVNMVTVGSRTLALYLIDSKVHATSGHCPHEGQCLDSGFVEQGTVECALHYAVFDIGTGALISGPTTGSLPVYPVRVDGDDVFVCVVP